MARILLGVTGGIAAYKACTLTRLLVRAGHDVYPLVTEAAERFVRAETFYALARKSRSDDPYPHLERADLLVVAPLTANTLARLAHGLADDLLTEAALAHAGPVLVAPAMNVRMWEHPATQANALLLRDRGVEIIGPAEGELAEGEVGAGRMVEPDAIGARIAELLGMPAAGAGSLEDRAVVISAGGTREPLDTVRFLGNRSSGRMGVALAEEARSRGADVTLLAANLAVDAPSGVTVIQTPTVADLEREALARADADVIVMAAAVADYRPPSALAGKRPKDAKPWTVELEPTPDVLAALGTARRAGQVLVGFAADGAESGLARAREKRLAKGADLFVFNDVSRADIGFDALENEVIVLSEDGELHVQKAPKREVAAAVLDEVERLLSKQ
ncbi:MAG: bifunctional phosphopantothenoylcysteine decarboxylase/phosphopantothenate--cysteine ligase CoaBC [Actinomycetota bacterium]|nr:bifunctional phosphopantothenoylcysteine decarboxylase/phosphopantothenate--cysteine ligase CoaBC [Actinomycetota bacterium]MDQ3121202.1 bifunctional phosphopantothenoylcysteine decarboxylase/phosphopantothenate--cysteine ligase CoaBC [Actinomycetota bacterium]